jgi:CRP-like cAMP-binding protein
MEKALLDYLSGFPSLTEAERLAIGQALEVRSFTRGTVLLGEGMISKECYFVLKGCVREYHIIDGIEKTTAFYTEGQAVVSFTSQSRQMPSGHYWVCTEDVLLIVGKSGNEKEMYARFPKLETITRQMMEQDLGKMQDDLARFKTSSAEERYREVLQQRPELLLRVPQHQLASYLGITPESLSRIRKRITPGKRDG